MVLLIDTNVLLDVLMKRQEFVKDSSLVWKLCETGKISHH
ncbi:MAG: PIN domain-containing protein [Erysipelotrichaceae bacterium]